MPRRVRTAPRRAPRQKRSEGTVEVLVRATEIAFERYGIARTTTNRIADIAGVSIGTVYQYFPTKEALVQAVVHRLWQAELEALASRAQLLETMPIDEAIRDAVRALTAVVASRKGVVRRWYNEASNLGDVETGLGLMRAASRVVEQILEKRRDELRHKDLAFASHLCVVTVLHAVRVGSRDFTEELDDGRLAEELSDMIARYLVRDRL
jgi:AcrR family transcriptional regulator